MQQTDQNGPFRGEHAQIGEQRQPGVRDQAWAELKAVLFQQPQAQDRIVDVVVARRTVHPATRCLRPARVQLETVRHRIECRDVVPQRIGVGKLQVAADPLRSPEVAVLDGLAEIAPGDPTQPATEDPVGYVANCCPLSLSKGEGFDRFSPPSGLAGMASRMSSMRIRLLVRPIRSALGLDQLQIQRLQSIMIIGSGRGKLSYNAGDVVAALDALPQFVLNKIGNAERVVHA